MCEYAWMCLNKRDSEYAFGSKYVKILKFKVLNMTKFPICECYTAFVQIYDNREGSEYLSYNT